MDWKPDNEVRDRFARLYADHYHDLYRYILTLIPHTEDAQEVLQDASVALWRKVHEYDPAELFLPWARQFAFLEVLNHRRRYARNQNQLSDAAIRLVAQDQEQLQVELERRFAALRDCLARLGPEDRELIKRRYQSEQTIQQLAAATDRPADTLYKRLRRIRDRLLHCVSLKLADEGGSA